jgi:RsiW-degrading membrane proteinase PrsW (M82 family)
MENFDLIDLWRLTSYLPMGENSIVSGNFRWNAEVFLALLGVISITYYVLGKIQKERLSPQSTPLFKSLFVAVIFCLGFTLATQWVGRMTYDHLRPDDRPPATSQNGKNPQRHRPHHANKGDFYALLALAGVIIVGGGYAFTVMHDLGPIAHFLGFSFGVGLTAELGKLIAVAIILSPGLGLLKSRTRLLPFLIAGLGFGLAEAFLYIADYSTTDLKGIEHYLRGTWSVLLHVSWAAITGYIVLKSWKKVPETGEIVDVFAASPEGTFLYLIIATIATGLLHGLYDALCAHNEPVYALLVGILSLFLGWKACEPYKIRTRNSPQAPVTE